MKSVIPAIAFAARHLLVVPLAIIAGCILWTIAYVLLLVIAVVWNQGVGGPAKDFEAELVGGRGRQRWIGGDHSVAGGDDRDDTTGGPDQKWLHGRQGRQTENTKQLFHFVSVGVENLCQ